MITVYPNPTQTIIDTAHKYTHEGRYFSGGFYNASVANGATIEILIQNVGSFHVLSTLTAGGESTLQIYEGTTFSVAGSAVTMSNHNRSSAKVFDGTATSTPTVTVAGTQMNGTVYVAAGDKHSSGVEHGFDNEYILAANTNYLIRGTNNSGGAIKMQLTIEGYQPNL